MAPTNGAGRGGPSSSRQVAAIADAEGADTLLHDDEQGIYGHPDHRATWRIGSTAAALRRRHGLAVTIDREHLQLVARDGHLVHGAARAAAVDYGRVTAEIALAVTGTADELARKRAAILAHASQIGPDDVLSSTFAAAYGYEWYRRTGAPGVLDQLGNAHLLAAARCSESGSRWHLSAPKATFAPSEPGRRTYPRDVAAPTTDPAAPRPGLRRPGRPLAASRSVHGRGRRWFCSTWVSAPRTLWWLALPAFALLGVAVHGRRARVGFALGTLFGLGFLLPLLRWTGIYVGPAPWLALSAAEALFIGAAGAGMAVVSRLPAAPAWAAAVWVAAEAVRSRAPVRRLSLGPGRLRSARRPAAGRRAGRGATVVVRHRARGARAGGRPPAGSRSAGSWAPRSRAQRRPPRWSPACWPR